jgi:hypothetical protein
MSPPTYLQISYLQQIPCKVVSQSCQCCKMSTVRDNLQTFAAADALHCKHLNPKEHGFKLRRRIRPSKNNIKSNWKSTKIKASRGRKRTRRHSRSAVLFPSPQAYGWPFPDLSGFGQVHFPIAASSSPEPPPLLWPLVSQNRGRKWGGGRRTKKKRRKIRENHRSTHILKGFLFLLELLVCVHQLFLSRIEVVFHVLHLLIKISDIILGLIKVILKFQLLDQNQSKQ